MLCLVYSAPADASTEDAAAHATGNGVASEVGRSHTPLRCRCCDVVFVCFQCFIVTFIYFFTFCCPPPRLFRPQARLQVRMLTVTATVMMTMTMSVSPLATLKLERHSTRRFSSVLSLATENKLRVFNVGCKQSGIRPSCHMFFSVIKNK